MSFLDKKGLCRLKRKVVFRELSVGYSLQGFPMHTGKTLIAQLMDLLPWTTFGRIVTRNGSDHRIRTLPCTEHFHILAFAS
jgi:hypothetical protein